MDFLNKAMAQANDLFRSMTAGTRITAGMLLMVIVISLVYLFSFQMHTGNILLFGARDFSQSELAAMQTAFAAANLNDFEVVGHRVRVPQSKMTDYLQALSDKNFSPVDFESAIDDVLSSDNGWFVSKQLREMKMKHAQEKKLGLVISKITGVDSATVQYRENRLGGYPPRVEHKVTVAVAPVSSRSLDERTVRAIQSTAAGWYSIPPDDVTVTDLVVGKAYVGKGGSGEFGSAETVYADTKRRLEEDWREKIYNCLSMYPDVVVGVNVELDPDLMNESKKVVVDTQPTSIESSTYTKTEENTPTNGGRPGADPNGVAGNTPRQVVSSNDTASTSEESRENQRNLAGHEEIIQKKAPLAPTLVTASISLPKSYYRKLWAQENRPIAGSKPKEPTANDLAGIEKSVAATIEEIVVHVLPPMPAGENPFPQVKVASYTDLPTSAPEEPSFADTGMAWFADNWQTLGMFGVGLMSLLMFRSMIKSATPAPVAESASLAARPESEHHSIDEANPDEEDEEEAAAALPRRASSGAPDLRSELSLLVKEDPDAAANILRSWIGDAA